ncbi:MAG: MFS transporter [Opitutales bacterium]|nr:MFS transporter [Opitutales bacterium]
MSTIGIPAGEQTAPEDRISIPQRLAYGLGALVNNLLGAAIGVMAIVLNLGLGMNPAVVGLLMALPRLTDALTDPIMGFVSDQSKTRWGRRRPFIFVGAIAAGLVFALLWQLPEGHSQTFYFWFFLCGSILFYLAYTVFATPWVALGYEMTPDYNERTRLMGTANFMGQIAWVLAPWFYWLMENKRFFDDSVSGARGLAIAVGVFAALVGIVPAIVCRERLGKAEAGQESIVSKDRMEAVMRQVKAFLKGFLITIRFRPFLKLCAATFLVFNGFMLVSAFSSYVIIFYVYSGDQSAGSRLMGWNGTVSAIATFMVIPLITWISTRTGKRTAFFIAIGISIFGYALKYFCYSQTTPMLLLVSTPFIAFGLGGLFTLMGSMIADVCDFDELETGRRREGMFGSIFWWVVKLGMALALALSGVLLNATGFDVELGGDQAERTLFLMRFFDVAIPIVASAVAIWLVASYTITEDKARAIRSQLEARRGKI